MSAGITHARVTASRRRTFLKALEETGSTCAAARAATPWARGRHGGLSSFRDAAARDPEFAADWERAEEGALGRMEAEIARRAMTPTLRPVVSNGKVIAHEEQYDNKLLLCLARALAPDRWSERSKLAVDQRVEPRVDQKTPARLDLSGLEIEEKRTMVRLLKKVKVHRDARALPGQSG